MKSNKRKFSLSECRKGGLAVKGWSTEEEERQRALSDAKGLVLRHGTSYNSDHIEGMEWTKRRALVGRTDQVEMLLGDRIVRTCGETKLTGKWKDFRGK